ncbi:MAG: hypothetical protein K1X79_08610 [Oligoflexia bacterium]|nr:hypothetical protein [Oligoflexia bacterium]
MSRALRHTGNVLLSFGLGLSLLTALAGSLSFWSSEHPDLFPAARYGMIPGVLLVALGLLVIKSSDTQLRLSAAGFAWTLLPLFLIDWLTRSYNLFQGPFIRGELILGLFAAFLILNARGWRALRIFSLCSLALLACAFLFESQGRILSSDDHPSFFYRLSLLKSQFPQIPFYYPYWNAGIDQRDFFATGSLNIFLLLWPIIRFFDLAHSYNILIAITLFCLMPVSVYTASRISGGRPTAALFSAVLAICSSLLWYRWALKYGTMGFVASASLIPLNLALLNRLIFEPQRWNSKFTFLTIASLCLMLLWGPSGLVFIPLALMAAPKIPQLFKLPHFRHVALGVLLLSLPWITIFYSVSQVGKFVSTKRPSYEMMADEKSPQYNQGKPSTSSDNKSVSPRQTLKVLRETSVSTNPLLILLLVPGLAALRRRQRGSWVATTVWLIVLGTTLSQVKPQLELDRMLVILSICSSIPVALALQRLFISSVYNRTHLFAARLPAYFALAFFLTGPFATSFLLRNRGYDTYSFRTASSEKLVQMIRDNAGDGRVVFTGFVLHDFSHGHLAPLPLLTGVPSVASSPFHDQWSYKELFPSEAFSQGVGAVEKLLDLYNSTLVVGHEERWVNFLRENKDHYALVGEALPFTVFRRKQANPSYFVQGQGQILKQNDNSIELTLSSAEAVLKFRYFPFLRSNLCNVQGVPSELGFQFIKLSACPLNETIKIESCGTWCRVLQGGS